MKKTFVLVAAIIGISTSVASAESEKIEPFVLKEDACIKYNKEQNKSTNEVVKKEIKDLDKKEIAWYFSPSTPKEIENYKEKYDAYYEGNNKNKEIYLTFDCGYENGVTSKILDVLKENNVKATFFVTGRYIDAAPNIVKRMEKEGHIVGNHTDDHPSLPNICKQNNVELKKEIETVASKYKKVTGKEMKKYLRPPMGAFSETSLSYSKDLGYKTIFWNCAYKDYDTKNQPKTTEAKKIINERTKDGGIILLHAISKTNAEILDDLIKDWKKNGYEIKSLEQL